MKFSASLLCVLVFCILAAPDATAQTVVRACGAVSVALPVYEAGKILRAERNLELVMGAVGGTVSGLEALGENSVNIAFSSRELTPIDRAAFPEIQFTEIPIGVQLVSMAVSRDVWEGGVRSITASQAQAIYEHKITNWKQLGGPNTKITVYMSTPGRGQWEIFVQWLYGEIRKAPVWHGFEAKESTEMRNMLEFTRGSFGLLPAGLVDHRAAFALAFRTDSGMEIPPTTANVLNDQYPLSRPLLLVINDRPTGGTKVVVDFMVSERGQALVKQTGYVTLEELKAAKAAQQ